MSVLFDAALPPLENAFSHLSEILLVLCLVAIAATVAVVLIHVLRKKAKQKGNRS